MEDYLMVSYDYCSSDSPTLCVARKENGRVRVLNTIRGNDAIFGYAWLTGLATLKNEQNKRRGCESEDNK